MCVCVCVCVLFSASAVFTSFHSYLDILRTFEVWRTWLVGGTIWSLQSWHLLVLPDLASADLWEATVADVSQDAPHDINSDQGRP